MKKSQKNDSVKLTDSLLDKEHLARAQMIADIELYGEDERDSRKRMHGEYAECLQRLCMTVLYKHCEPVSHSWPGKKHVDCIDEAVGHLLAKIASLEAENKRLAEERDGWKREAEAFRNLGIACETIGGDIDAANKELNDAIAANDARAGGKEDGHGN